jgi:iron complex outermembrane receptor protein
MWLLGGLSATVYALGVSAAETRGPALEEVIVTAQKREESLQQAPISIVAFSADKLRSNGIQDIADLRGKVPNLELGPFSLSQTALRLFIRGVGVSDVQITQDPSVGVYLDGVYVARSSGLSMSFPELERIEVLRGPQGTLYGRNSTGGALNMITARPDPSAASYRLKLGVGNYAERDLYARANLPVTDHSAVRLAWQRSRMDGPVENTGDGRDFGSQDRRAGRFDWRWQPLDDVTVDYGFDYAKVQDVSLFYQGTIPSTALPFIPDGAGGLLPVTGAIRYGDRRITRAAQSKPVKPNDTQVRGHALTLSWDSGDITLKSITAYRDLDDVIRQDFSAGHPFLTLFASETDTTQHQFSQEFQLLGKALDEQIDYITGLYYFTESARSTNTATIFAPDATANRSSADNSAEAVFGQLTYSPAALDKRLHVTVGGRYSRDRRRATIDVVDNTVPTAFSGKGSKDFSKFTPSLTVEYDTSATTNVYAKVATGYKTGGFNIRASSASSFANGFNEENLTSYEAGFKGEFFERRLRANTAVFLSKYDDIQLNVAIPGQTNAGLTDTLNAGKADIKGLELDLTAAVTEALTLSAGYAYIDAEYKKVDDPLQGDIHDQFQFQNTPKHGYNVAADYQFPALPFGELALNVNYSWQGAMVANPRVSQEPGSYLDAYGLLNARLTLSSVPLGNSGAQLALSLWGKNLTDKDNMVDAVASFDALHAVGLAAFGMPRTYGMDLSLSY